MYPFAYTLAIATRIFDYLGQHRQPKALFTTIIAQTLPIILQNTIEDWKPKANRVKYYATYVGTINAVVKSLVYLQHMDCERLTRLAKTTKISWETFFDMCMQSHDILTIIERDLAAGKISPEHFDAAFDSATLRATKALILGLPSRIHCALRLPADDTTYAPHILAASSRLRRSETAARALSRYAPNLYRAEICGNRACMEIFSTDHCALRACAGCKHMFYCSRSCQKTAWKDGAAAHRDVCGTLRGVMTRIGREEMEPDVFAQRCEVDDETLMKVVDNLVVVYSR